MINRRDTFGSTALPLALNAEGEAPDWIMLIPAGPIVCGRDGRRWTLKNPQAVATAFAANRAALPVDIEHAQFELAPKGQPAPACGWVEDVAVRDGAVWGRVDWNAAGRDALRTKSYRYVSPVFSFNRAGEIQALKGVGLVNRPNLDLPALNREDTMNWTKLLAALGLSETATEDEAVAAVAKLKGDMEIAENRAKTPPALDKFVPRPDYDLALNRATKAETDLAGFKTAQADKDITGLVEAAISDGKIVPASKDFYIAACRAEGGIERFREFVAKAVVTDPAKKSGLDDKKPDPDVKTLTADEIATCRALGLSSDEFIAARA